MATSSAAKDATPLDVPSCLKAFLAMPTISRARFLPMPGTSNANGPAASSSSTASSKVSAADASFAPVWVSSSVKSITHDETRTWQQTYVWNAQGQQGQQSQGAFVPLGYPTALDTLASLPSPSRKLVASFRNAPTKEGAAPSKVPVYLIEIADADPSSASYGRVLHSLSTSGLHGRVFLTGNFGGFAWSNDERSLVYMAEPKAEDRRPANFFPTTEEQEKERAQSGPRSAPTKGTEFELREDWGEQLVGVRQPRPYILRWGQQADSAKLYSVRGIPEDVSAGQVIFSGWCESTYRKPAASSSAPALDPAAPVTPASEPLFDEGLYMTIYPNVQGGDRGRKLGMIYFNTRASHVAYLSARCIIDPARDAEEKRAKERKIKLAREEALKARLASGAPALTAEEEKEAEKADYQRQHDEAQREKRINRLVILTPRDHSAQSPRLDGFSPPQLLYITTDPVWHHCAGSRLKTFITLPATLGLFLRTVDAPYDSVEPDAHVEARVFDSNTHEMIPIVEKPSSVSAFPGLWPVGNVLPNANAFAFDERHIILHSQWRSQQALLLCSDEDDSLARLPLPLDAPADASFHLHDVDRATGRLLVGVSSMAQAETLYVAQLRVLAPEETVSVGADYLPVCVVHKDGSAYEDQEATDDVDDVAYAQVRYTRVLAPAQPLHPEAARRLSRCRMEVISVPVPAEETYPDGSAQLPYEAVLLTPGFDASKADAPAPPLLVFPHGGPHSTSPTSFVPHVAFMAVCGFSVLYINYRASPGFGQAMLNTLPGKCGKQDVQDCLRAVELVASRTGAARVCDRSNLHVQGGSHGGFLTTHLIGQAPDLFQTAVARNPVCNIAGMIGSSDIPGQYSGIRSYALWAPCLYWCWFEVFGTPYDASAPPSAESYAALFAASPLAHVSRVRTPLLMLLGGADRRVPAPQAHDYIKHVASLGTRTRTLFYPDGKHPLGESVAMEGDVWVNMVMWAMKRFDATEFSLLPEA